MRAGRRQLTRISIGGNFDDGDASTATRRCSTSCASRSSPTQLAEGRVQADHPREAAGAAEGPDSADRGRRARASRSNGACMTSAGTGVSRASATPATSSTRRWRSCARRRRSAGSRPCDGVHMGPCEIHKRTPTRSAPTARSSPAPASPARRCSRPATSTAAQETYRSAGAAAASSGSPPGSSATTARSSRSAPAAARVASHNELGDMHAPNCHKTSFEAGVVTLARQAAARAEPALAG